MSTQFDWEGFRALAGRLESLLAGEAKLAEDDTFIEACRRALAFLYVAGVSMPAAGGESLAAGNEHYDAKRPMEAEWEWSFGFDEWGAHAIGALAALHDLLWGAR